jgi:hypothetical protein
MRLLFYTFTCLLENYLSIIFFNINAFPIGFYSSEEKHLIKKTPARV